MTHGEAFVKALRLDCLICIPAIAGELLLMDLGFIGRAVALVLLPGLLIWRGRMMLRRIRRFYVRKNWIARKIG